MQLLDETSVLEVLKAMLGKADQAKLAVAFWGKGAIEALGLARADLELKLVCNLDSGACNPDELRRLLALPNVEVKTHPSLHAKIYWTAESVVIGSSNASSNGLVVEGAAAGWREANVQLSNPEILDRTEARFDHLFEEADKVTPADIDRAALLWRTRARMAPNGERLPRSLFDAFNASPKHSRWRRLKIAYCRDDLEPEDEAWIEAEKAARRIHPDVMAYSHWNDLLGEGDQLIAFAHEDGAAVFDDLWLVEPSFAAAERQMRLVSPLHHLKLPPLGQFKLSAAERKALADIEPEVLRGRSEDSANAVIDFAAAMAMVKARTAVADAKAFDRAMLAIYEEAGTFGYHPTIFLDMLNRHRGQETARRLVHGQGTKGFLRLWNEKRLDLSVEALIIKSRWRGLFHAETVDQARKTLRQYHYVFEAADEDAR